MAKTKQNSRSNQALIAIANKHLDELDRQRNEAYNQVITDRLNGLGDKERVVLYSFEKKEFLVKNANDKRWPEGFALFDTVGGKKPPLGTVETDKVETQTEARKLIDVGVQTEVQEVVTEAGEQEVGEEIVEELVEEVEEEVTKEVGIEEEVTNEVTNEEEVVEEDEVMSEEEIVKEKRGEQKRRRELEAAVELVRREQEERSGRKRPAYEHMVALAKKAKAKVVRDRKSVTQLERLNNLKKKLLLKERTYAFEDNCEPKERTMVVGVDFVEEQNQRLERMRLLLENYVSYDGGSKRLKGIKLKYCLDAWRLFQIEMKKEKKSRRKYVACFPVDKRGALGNMLNQGQKLQMIADWLNEDEFEFWKLMEALEIDFSATNLSLFEKVFK